MYNGRDLRGVNESAPLCTDAPCAYPTSKAAAERLISAANSRTLTTIALRPHLVWGPGDRNVIPRVLALAKKGGLKVDASEMLTKPPRGFSPEHERAGLSMHKGLVVATSQKPEAWLHDATALDRFEEVARAYAPLHLWMRDELL